LPDKSNEVATVARIAMHPSRPNVLFMQKHWDVTAATDGGENWHEVSGNLARAISGFRSTFMR